MGNTKKFIERTELVEKMIRGLVKEFQFTPLELMTGLHNACTHAEIFTNDKGDLHINLGEKDVRLKELFKGFDISIEAASKM